jgi:hypothetical protein
MFLWYSVSCLTTCKNISCDSCSNCCDHALKFDHLTLNPWWLSHVPFKSWKPLAHWYRITSQKTEIHLLPNLILNKSSIQNKKKKGGGPAVWSWERNEAGFVVLNQSLHLILSALLCDHLCVGCRDASSVEISFNKCPFSVKCLL